MEFSTVKKYAKCLLTGLKDLHVIIHLFSIIMCAIEISNLQISWLIKITLNFVILGQPKYLLLDIKIFPTFVRGIIELLNCCLELSTTVLKLTSGLLDVSLHRCWLIEHCSKEVMLMECSQKSLNV